MIVCFHFVTGQAKRATGLSVEVDYWSTLTTRGRRDVAREEEVGRGLYHSAVSWQMKRTAICRKYFSPLSSPPIMDTKPISFKERPDTVTLYQIVDFNPRKRNARQFTTSVLCTDQWCSESSVHRGEFVLNVKKCSVCLLLFRIFNLN